MSLHLNPSRIKEYTAKIQALKGRWGAHAKQSDILRSIFNDGYRRVFIQAGRKFGKTELIMYIAVRIALLQDHAACYIIGPSRKQQHEILWANSRLQRFMPDFGQHSIQSELRIELPSGSFVKVDGSENYEAYRGTEYDVMIIDEFATADPRFYDACYPNLLARNGILVLIGTPPDRENHFIRVRDEWRLDEDCKFFHGTSWDNPFLPGGRTWLEKEKRKYYARGEGAVWEREYEARFIPGGANAIFPMFTRKTHVRDRATLSALIARDRHKLEWYVVCDPGTTSCFAVSFVAYNRYTSQVFVLDEIYEKDPFKATSRRIWERVLEKKQELYPNYRPDRWRHIYDVAAAWFRSEVLDRYPDEHLIPVDKKAGEKENHLSLMKDVMLNGGNFYVASECEKTVWEISNYIKDENGKVPDKDDHLIDCLRYFFNFSGYTVLESTDQREPETRRALSPEDDFQRREASLDLFDRLGDDNVYDYH